MLRAALRRAVHTPLQVAMGAKKHSTAVILLDKEQTPPDWVRLSPGANEDLDRNQSIWLYDQSLGYSRIHVKRLKQKTYTEDPTTVFKSACETISALKAKKVPNGDIYLPTTFTQVLSGYSYLRKTYEKEDDKPVHVTEINCVDPPKHDSERLNRVIKSAEAALYARDLGNMRGSEGTPDVMVDKVKALIAQYESLPITLEIIKGEDLVKRGLGMMYAVGKGAMSPPSLVWVSYAGDQENSSKVLTVIGKGLTFDTGGLNLKPTGHIEDMYLDKSGACGALGVLKWVLDTKAKVNLSVGLGFVENAIDSRSYKPNDILTSLKGLTVEVGNTDAEGRLVLGDVFTYVQRKLKPTVMVDMATLTGACVVALGEQTAGAMGNSEELIASLKKAGEAVDERIWHLPITEEHKETIKSKYADISNSGSSKYGGAGKGAAFLARFVEKDTKWAHLDIAGPAMISKSRGQFSAGCTGFGTQLLNRYILDQW